MSSGLGCTMPSDATIAGYLSSSHAASATQMVGPNTACTTQWAWGTANDGSGKYCVCVLKPGQYQESTTSWFVWDCQSQWW